MKALFSKLRRFFRPTQADRIRVFMEAAFVLGMRRMHVFGEPETGDLIGIYVVKDDDADTLIQSQRAEMSTLQSPTRH